MSYSPHAERPRLVSRLIAAAAAATLLGGLLVGVPWGLARYVGWPLPTRLPSGAEIIAVLSQPPSKAMMINLLACMCWALWACFVLDVLLALGETTLDLAAYVRSRGARTAQVSQRQRWRPGAALVGVIVVALLAGSRPTPATTSVASASITLLQPAAHPTQQIDTHDNDEAWATVRGPQDGVHDSLWRIADRELGDPHRWREIYNLNVGRPQADGRALVKPGLIQPDWHLAMPIAAPSASDPRPDTASDSAPPNHAAPDPVPNLASAPPAPDVPGPTSPSPGPDISSAPALPAPAPSGDSEATPPDWHIDDKVVWIGATAAVAASALAWLARYDRARAAAREVIVRRRPRRRPIYDPGLDCDDDETLFTHQPTGAVTPISEPVDSAGASQVDTDWYPLLDAAPGPLTPSPSLDAPTQPIGSRQPRDDGPWLQIGIHTDGPVLISPRSIGGLGLTGPVAPDVARAILLTLLTSTHRVAVVVDADTASYLLEHAVAPTPLPTDPDIATAPRPGRWLHVTPDPITALTIIETETDHRRSRAATQRLDDGDIWVIVTPPPTNPAMADRLDAALTAGAPLGVTAIIAGPWPHGWTATISPDYLITHHTPTRPGTVSPANLVGAVLFAQPATALAAHVNTAGNAETPTTAPAPQPPRPRDHHATAPETIHTSDHGGHGNVDDASRTQVESHTTTLTAEHDTPPTNGSEHNGNGHRPTTMTRPKLPTVETQSAGRRTPLRLTLFGPTNLTYRPVDNPDPRPVPVAGIGPRATELLAYLGVHPAGVDREKIATTLWPTTGRRRATNPLNSTLHRLRAALTRTHPSLATLVTLTGTVYTLDTDLIEVDYWDFTVAASHMLHPDTTHRAQACRAVIDTYADHLTTDNTSEWAALERADAHRRYLRALSTLARIHSPEEPEQALDLLETARTLEPHKEAIYCDIMRLQARLGRHDEALDTFTLLETHLATIDTKPDRATLDLATSIRANAQRLRRSQVEALTNSSRRPRAADGPANESV